nr:elongation factor G, III-V domain-containing protein [Tanacetum cinerariifolium]
AVRCFGTSIVVGETGSTVLDDGGRLTGSLDKRTGRVGKSSRVLEKQHGVNIMALAVQIGMALDVAREEVVGPGGAEMSVSKEGVALRCGADAARNRVSSLRGVGLFCVDQLLVRGSCVCNLWSFVPDKSLTDRGLIEKRVGNVLQQQTEAVRCFGTSIVVGEKGSTVLDDGGRLTGSRDKRRGRVEKSSRVLEKQHGVNIMALAVQIGMALDVAGEEVVGPRGAGMVVNVSNGMPWLKGWECFTAEDGGGKVFQDIHYRGRVSSLRGVGLFCVDQLLVCGSCVCNLWSFVRDKSLTDREDGGGKVFRDIHYRGGDGAYSSRRRGRVLEKQHGVNIMALAVQIGMALDVVGEEVVGPRGAEMVVNVSNGMPW